MNKDLHAMTAVRLLASLLAVGGCVAEGPDGHDREGSSIAETDVFATVPVLRFSEEGRGRVGGQHIDVFALELTQGDQITLVQTMSGPSIFSDEHPRLTFDLYLGFTGKLTSASQQTGSVDGDPTLEKTYAIGGTGRHYLVVRAEEGEAAYRTALWCTAGPCAGSRIVDAHQANACIRLARECALPRTQPGGGLSDDRIFRACLGEARLEDGTSTVECDTACDVPGGADLCESVVYRLQLLANIGLECITEPFEACMNDCTEQGAGTEWSSLDEGTEARCMIGGFSGMASACDSWADNDCDDHPSSAHGNCEERCYVTIGPWSQSGQEACVAGCPD